MNGIWIHIELTVVNRLLLRHLLLANGRYRHVLVVNWLELVLADSKRLGVTKVEASFSGQNAKVALIHTCEVQMVDWTEHSLNWVVESHIQHLNRILLTLLLLLFGRLEGDLVQLSHLLGLQRLVIQSIMD